MSSDTAAFFAAKKKGKKKKFFKFNANNIDTAQVSSTIHVDAPAVSSEVEPAASNSLSASKNIDTTAGEWEETKTTSPVTTTTTAATTTAATGNGPAELLDMKALERKRNEQDDIAERMRVEETKAKLAAAREGMEKEAQRLKEEKEAKEAKRREREEANASSRFGAAASNIGSTGGSRWVPPHMRSSGLGGGPAGGGMGTGRSGPRFGAAMNNVGGSGYQRKVDTGNEELFPDLGTAEKMIAKEEKQKQAATAVAQEKMKAKAVAAAAEKKKAEKEAQEAAEAKAQAEAEAAAAAEAKAKAAAEAAKAKAVASDGAAAAPKKKVVKKKKKKDLSTFKSS